MGSPTLTVFLLLFGLLVPLRLAAQAPPAFDDDVAPFLAQHCIACHSGERAKGGLDLRDLDGAADSAANLLLVLHLRRRVEAGDMPPPERPRPDPKKAARVVAWARTAVRRNVGRVPKDPGQVTVRRLSRSEYDNTIRELFGVDVETSNVFPADDLGYGFDNIGDALSVSVLHVEKYAAAAEEIAAKVISTDDPDHPPKRRFQAEFLSNSLGDRASGSDATNLFTNATITHTLTAPRDGVYRIRVRAWATQAGNDVAKMDLDVDAKRMERFEVRASRDKPETYLAKQFLKKGRRMVEVSFINDYYDPKHKDRRKRDRNLIVDWIEFEGPIDRVGPTKGQEWIFAEDPKRGTPAVRARPIVRELLSRVWRRPATSMEVKRRSTFVQDAVKTGKTFKEAIRLVLTASLVSPHFLFRMEPGGHRGVAGEIRHLDPWHLASRLSYFLWSGPPDATLADVARKKQLADPDALVRQVRRMLEDPRADALATGFAAQWLELRNLDDIQPDPDRFPLSSALKDDLRRETELFFLEILKKRRPVSELLAADFTYLNARLAAHYGVKGVEGDELRRVKLSNPRRGGLVTHGSIHAVTSNPSRTSPVKRGKWILENLLDAPPPPPPPGVESLKDDDEIKDAATLREAMEKHRSQRMCAGCHVRMDALGLALENYDPIGRWRSRDGGRPIDASGELPGGIRVAGPEQLKRLLVKDDSFVRCVLKKLFVYAVGRDVNGADELALESLVLSLDLRTATLEDLIVGVVRLDAFRKRRIGR